MYCTLRKLLARLQVCGLQICNHPDAFEGRCIPSSSLYTKLQLSNASARTNGEPASMGAAVV